MIIFLKNKHTLQIDDFYFKCSIGKKGISKNKLEGDKKTKNFFRNYRNKKKYGVVQ